jgi:tRNA(Ile)-lysidine synthase
MNFPFAEEVKRKWPADRSYLVAVSGGRDSMALLHFLCTAGYRDLMVCHVNHSLRGEASDQDADLVAAESKRLGFEAEIRTVNVAAFASLEKLSIETAARELRYRCFAEISREKDCPRLFLAHHADDRIETVLMNFFRGAGTRGLAGIEEETTRRIDETEISLIRPFLPLRREEISGYATKHGIAFREDESNQSDFALRNRIRNRLIPTLKEVFQRDVTGAVLRAADLAALDEAWANEAAGDLPLGHNGAGLDVRKLREFSAAHRNRLLLTWLRQSGVPDCGSREVARVAEVALSNDTPAKTNLPGGHHVRRREGLLFIESPA